MGFTIDMISGEIQDDSSSAVNRLESTNNTRLEELDICQPMTRIQEYVPFEEAVNTIPDSIVNVDIDAFIERM